MKQTRDKSCGKTDRQPGAWISRLYLLLALVMLVLTLKTCVPAVDAALTRLSGAARLWGDRIFEKCGIGRDERGDGGKTLEIRGKRRLSARDGGANYQQS